ncbi:MAG: site-specific DNA-methyltransferase [Phenylobacterium sp.]|uniref:site-specific DNA-methyltransferase n=1 Tax=Phenylobacterium sp. TaxID=1871053 RepID=UPI0027279259|nr:site-specific DNA-methyltransferase [Phenylobacterium sp.]MDO8913997.1 site-specific DNA-methyltransferase [Phenylobacterium sp.]MDP3099763.1 site-specific DNA-methyltransferase [Phenylobacterium sp.]
MPDLFERSVERVPIADLAPAKRNARTHSEAQVKQIAASMERFGVTNPALIDDHNRIIAGHGRVAAAKTLGHADFPCLRLSHLSEAEKRAYVLADNKLALNAGWDKDLLAIDLRELAELQFDVSLTGFSLPEIDIILTEADDAAPNGDDPSEDPPPSPAVAGPAVTRPGDLWVLGRHRLLCGDAKDSAAIALLMDGGQADMLFTDPPYNVPIDGHVSGLGQVRHREFAEGVGEMTASQFTAFLQETLGAAALVCRDGAIAFVCMDWRHLQELLTAGHAVFSELKNLCVWNKTNAGMGTFYRSQHELVLVWKCGAVPHTNNFGLGDKGRYRTNVWTYAGANAFKAERLEELKLHPTVKPVALVADAIRDVTNRGQVVLDVFGGSGTTLIAAQKTGRSARLIELDPIYCDVIIRRWQKLSGKSAALEGDGRTFEAIAESRNDTWTNASTGWAA